MADKDTGAPRDAQSQESKFNKAMPSILAAIMASTSEMSFVKDINFVYRCSSLPFARLVGYQAAEDLIGKTDYELFVKEVADKYRADDERLIASGKAIVDMVELIPSDDGVPHYASTSKYPLIGEDGSIVGLYGVGRDITEYRTAFERLKIITDSPPCGLVMFELSKSSMKTLYFSDGLYRFSGYTRAEFEEISLADPLHLVFEEDRIDIKTAFELLQEEGSSLDCYYRCHTRDGGFRWFHMLGTVSERRGDVIIVNAVQFDVTEQRAAQDVARIHEEEMKLAMSQMGKMICEYDPVTHIMTVPEAYAEQFGMPTINYDVPNSMLRGGFIDEAYHKAYLDFFEAILRADRTGATEYRALRQNGAERWERADFASIFSAQGKPVKTIITIEDTTQQHVKYELEQQRPMIGEDSLLVHALFNLTTGETLDYAYRDGRCVPPDMRTVPTNGEADLSQIIVNDEERKRFIALNDPEALLSRFEKGQTELSIDYRRRIDDDEVIWVRNILRMLRKPGGDDILLFEYCYNIEEDKTRELMYSTLIDKSYDYVARVNARTKSFSVIVNSGMEYGMPPSRGSNIDHALRDLVKHNVHPEDQDMTIANMTVAGVTNNLRDKDHYGFTCRMIARDGSIMFKKFTEYYLDRDREIYVILREDITSLMNDEAEKNTLLASALSAANQANNARTQFLSRMSHELRTPMNAIIGLCALSASELDNPRAMEDSIAKIGMSARHLLSLINDILEMTRIESGRMTLNEEPFDFERFISDVNAIIYAQANSKGVDYDAMVNTYLEPSYVGDSTKLQEILVNVLGNAVKFTPAGGKVTLAIEQLRSAGKRATIRFIVSDTGVGIDNAYMPKLFEPFSQEQDNLNAAASGTGLGLAITKSLVEMMNGQITVQSIKNVGSVFTIDVQLGMAENRWQYKEILASMNLGRLSALVVDDDIIVCQSTESILKAMGMNAEWVDSGMGAVERVKQRHESHDDFDTVFVDWKMPGMDGIETARQIRAIVGPDVTIIIITAYDWRSIEEQAREAGVDMFMEKPLFQSSIVKAFEKVFLANRQKIEPVAAEIPDLTGRRVLLTEDHPLNMEIAKRLLEKVGAEVVTAGNGLEALEIFATSKDDSFDAILMDIRMPIMDGLTATRSIRNLRKKGSKTIPIIAMTANAFDEDVELSLSSGMDAHLSKPIEPKLMYATLDRLIRYDR